LIRSKGFGPVRGSNEEKGKRRKRGAKISRRPQIVAERGGGNGVPQGIHTHSGREKSWGGKKKVVSQKYGRAFSIQRPRQVSVRKEGEERDARGKCRPETGSKCMQCQGEARTMDMTMGKGITKGTLTTSLESESK